MTQAQALEILKTGASVFLTGEPGSGKTHVINEYVNYLRCHNIEPAITASTGIASTHINGMTVHSWSGIGIKKKLSGHDLDNIISKAQTARRIKRSRVLIIDEVSMLSPETLSMVELVCRKVRQSYEPFGGLQVVLAGDFFQLPPVVRQKEDYDDDGNQTQLIESEQKRFAFDSTVWNQAKLVVCYLTEQYRQSDPDFLSLLLSIRSNTFDEDHLEKLQSRRVQPEKIPSHAPKLFSHNIDVDNVNQAMLKKLPGLTKTFNMTAWGYGPIVAGLKKNCLSPETLHLKIGARVMFTKNNSRLGFVNGTLGEVAGFVSETGQPIVRIKDFREIEVEQMNWLIEDRGRELAGITQFPLRLAWAITVHKSQGMSLDEAVMDLSNVFEYGQGYVALSRVRDLAGLYLLGWNERAFQVDPEVLSKDEMFRALSEKAEIGLKNLSATELTEKQTQFIVFCDGSIEVAQEGSPLSTISPRQKKKPKGHSLTETKDLLAQKKSISEIAQARGLTISTVAGHIDKIKSVEPEFDLSHLKNSLDEARFIVITKAFQRVAPGDNGYKPLGPVKEILGDDFSYDEIRLARLFLDQ
ncbi:MAG: AAA family ATPase [bacterium]|nr:AAA family ATPase [bacterium]